MTSLNVPVLQLNLRNKTSSHLYDMYLIHFHTRHSIQKVTFNQCSIWLVVVRTVCLLASELLALVVEESQRMPEMSHLQAEPLGLHDDNSDGIIETTLLLHAETGTQRLKTTSWSPTPSHTHIHTLAHAHTRTHANECLLEYVYKGDGRVGWASDRGGVMTFLWHFMSFP